MNVGTFEKLNARVEGEEITMYYDFDPLNGNKATLYELVNGFGNYVAKNTKLWKKAQKYLRENPGKL